MTIIPSGCGSVVVSRTVGRQSDPDDLVLLDAWRGGDRGAGDTLFIRHFPAVQRFFRNKVSADAIEDLVQRTFLVLIEQPHRFRGQSKLSTFLLGIANNLMREHYRTKRRASLHDDFERVSVTDLGVGPTTAVGWKRECRVLLEALRRMPLNVQTLLELYYWESLTGREIASVLEVPENTARTRLRRARERLAREIARVERLTQPLESTLENLERWASSLRVQLGR